MRLHRVSSVVIFVAMLLCVPQVGTAQLRSLHAIRYATIVPAPPEAEQLHQELTRLVRRSWTLVDTPETLPVDCPQSGPSIPGCQRINSWEGPGPRARFARCTIRTNLPPPRPEFL